MCDNCTMIQKCTVVHFFDGDSRDENRRNRICRGRKGKRLTMSDRKLTEQQTYNVSPTREEGASGLTKVDVDAGAPGSTQANQAAGPEATEKLTKRENLAQVIKFVLFSVSAGIIETVSFTVLDMATGWSYWPCYLIALILSVVWNFTLNREFTFKSANNVPVAMMKVAAFYCVFTPLSTWWGHALTSAGWNEYAVLLGTMAVNLTTEFLYDRFFVFRGSMNTNQRAQAGKAAPAGRNGRCGAPETERNGRCGATETERNGRCGDEEAKK